ncbi:transposase, partial [Anaerostipes hadrus]|nr:transposase [Anaerostipes hadrus]
RLEQKASKFQWPRSQEEVCKLTSQQFRWLMEGLTIKPKKCIQKIDHPRFV